MRSRDEPGKQLRLLQGYLKFCFLVVALGAAVSLANPSLAEPLVLEGEMFENVEQLLQDISAQKPIFKIAWRPDGRVLAAGAEDGTVTIWDVLEGKQVKSLRDHSQPILSLSFNSDGNRLAAASDQGIIVVWDFVTLETLPLISGGWSVAFKPQSDLLASGLSNGDVYLWDLESAQRALKIDRGHLDRVSSVAWNQDGTKLATGSWDRTMKLWDGASGSLLHRFEGHENRVSSISWSADGRYLASASLDGTVRIWDTETGHEIQKFEGHTSAVHAVAWRPDGPLLASASRDATVRLWHILEQKGIALLDRRHQDAILDVAFSPRGTMLASASEDGTVSISPTSLGLPVPYADTEIRRLRLQAKSVSTVAIDKIGHTFAAATKDELIHIWLTSNNDSSNNAMEGPETLALEGQRRLTAIALSPSGNVLAAGFEEGSIHLWSSKDGRWEDVEILHPIIAHEAPVTALAFGPDEKILASSASELISGTTPVRTIHVWNWHSLDRERIDSLQSSHVDKITSLAFSTDGKLLASGSNDRTVRVLDWRANREVGAPIRIDDRVQGVGFTEDGLLEISSSGRVLLTWDPIRRTLLVTHDWHDRLRAVAFASETSTILSVVDNQGLLRVETQTPYGDYEPHQFLLPGQESNWIRCSSGGRCWRYDDGSLLLKRNASMGELEPIPPPADPRPRLRVSPISSELAVRDGELASFDIEVRNVGSGRAFWVNVSQTETGDESALVFYSPPPQVVLDPDESVRLKCRLAIHSSYENPQSVRLPLSLHISSAHADTIMTDFLEVVSSVPSIRWKDARLALSGSKIEATVVNDGPRAFNGDYFTATLDDHEIGPILIEEQAGVEPGEELSYIFDLPAGINGRAIESLDFTVYRSSAPPHRWVFLQKPVTKFPVSLPVILVMLGGASLALLSFGIRLLLHKRYGRGLHKWAGRRRHATLAVVFTDIIRSTNLVNELEGAAWTSVRNAHFEQGKRLIEQYAGYKVRSTGDGMMIVFRNAVDAVHFALGLERSTGHRLIEVRAGIHIGQVEIDHNDVHGRTVHMAARITDMAKDGGVWLSEAVRNDYIEMYGDGSSYHWEEHPKCELKGFDGSYTLWSVSS